MKVHFCGQSGGFGPRWQNLDLYAPRPDGVRMVAHSGPLLLSIAD